MSDSIFDAHYSTALSVYELEDGRKVSFGEIDCSSAIADYADDLCESDSEGLFAIGDWRGREQFLAGNKELFNLAQAWAYYEQTGAEDDAPNSPEPVKLSEAGFVQGQYVFVYMPHDHGLDEESQKDFLQRAANIVFNRFFQCEIIHPGGEDSEVSVVISDYECGTPRAIVYGDATNDEVATYLNKRYDEIFV